MSHQFTIQVSPPMLKQTWHAWYFRNERISTLVLAVVAILGAAAYDLRNGSLSVLSTVNLTGLGLLLILTVSMYFIGLRRMLARLQDIPEGRATYTLTDAGIEASSAMGSVSLNWSAVAELRRYQDLVLLGFKGALYSTLPASQIPNEALTFLLEHCRTAGAKITGF